MPPPIAQAARLRASLDRLAERIEAASFPLDNAARPARNDRAEKATALIRRYLLPRLGDPDAPLLVAVFGPTGGGKSTLVNSLAGREVSMAGVLRPTTTQPLAWCHRRNAHRYEMPTAPDDHPLLDRLTIVDTPDLDSHMVEHRRVAERVLQTTDAAIYVTTPQRYADAVPWEVVSDLASRAMPLVVVANRLSRRSSGAVADLASLLRDHGLHESRRDHIISIQEHRLRGGGLLPAAAVGRVLDRLRAMAKSPEEVIRATVVGAIRRTAADAAGVAADLVRQADEGEALWEAVRVAFVHQADEIAQHLDAGDLVKTQVVARWQRMAGVTDLAALVDRGWARLRDLAGRPHQREEVGEEVRQELADLVVARVRRAIIATASAWEIEPGGKALLTPDLRSVGPDLEAAALDQVDGWLAGLVELVAEGGRNRFQLARAASIGINATATVLLLGVFVHTGGLTGAEVGVAAGAAAAQQTVLEHLFGSATAGRLARRARQDLADRLERLVMAEADPFRWALVGIVDTGVKAQAIAEAIRVVEHESLAFQGTDG